MPVKAGVWENPEFLMELSLALFQVASGGGALSTQAKSAVEAYLKAQGHDQSWESIRCILALMKWDAAAHEAMLICIVKHCELNSHNMAKILDEMQKKGYEFTERAFRFTFFSLHTSVLAILYSFRSQSLRFKSIAFLIVPEKSSRRWDATAHEALLFAMIEEFKPNKESIMGIVGRLRAMGHDYTFHGVNQHIQKLRKARDTSALDGSGDSSKPATPRKATPRKTPTSTRKHKVETDEDADELGLDIKKEDEKGSMATPSKRPKIE
ncbi:hypothetical protein MY5147_003873 [Beauveria neobassiana]